MNFNSRDTVTCPKCGAIAEFNHYRDVYECTSQNCGWEGYDETVKMTNEERSIEEQALIKAAFLVRDLENFDKYELKNYLKKSGINISSYMVEKIIHTLFNAGYIRLRSDSTPEYGYVYEIVRVFGWNRNED